MNKAIKLLEENSLVAFATVNGNKPKVRPFQMMFADKNKMYFCTANTKEVFYEMQNNSKVAFTVTLPDYSYIRVDGEVEFTDDLEIKSRILAGHDLVRSIYKSADNPVFEAFFVKNGSMMIADLKGNPPQVFKI